jgi:anhydro-N-acetylmuramic acid kinase
MTRKLFIGLMSGTSLDGVDVALVEFKDEKPQPLLTHFLAYPSTLRSAVLALQHPTANELEETALISNALAKLYALAIEQLLAKAQLSPSDITAVGCHGQTIRHRPGFGDGIGFTMQIGNAALLTELCQITVVADFRSRDVAAGGQGAPLVPAFHQAVFADKQLNRAIINLGGIANITYLSRNDNSTATEQNSVVGFDSGPGNMLLDAWIKQQLGQDYDANGAWASSGQTIPALLRRLLQEDFFAAPPPKSTGRDLFNLTWLENNLQAVASLNAAMPAHDVAHTLVDLSAESVYAGLKMHCPAVDEVYLCGGGAHNQLLVKKLQSLLGPIPCKLTDSLGIDVDWVEAVAFAWLAKQCLDKKTANLAPVTGAGGARILGAIYQH